MHAIWRILLSAMSHTRMSHVIHANEPCHIHAWVMPHIWMSHVTHMSESCHTYEWAMSHTWVRHIAHMNEPCHTYEWAMPRAWMSHFTHKKWAMLHIWMSQHERMSHVAHMNEPCHPQECAMSHIWMSHVTHMNELPESMCLACTRCSACACLRRRTASSARASASIWCCVCDTSCHIWIRDVTHMNESCHTHVWVMSVENSFCARLRVLWCRVWDTSYHIWMRHVSQMNESCHAHEWVMSHPRMSPVSGEQLLCAPRRLVLLCVWYMWMSHVTRTSGVCPLIYAPGGAREDQGE